MLCCTCHVSFRKNSKRRNIFLKFQNAKLNIVFGKLELLVSKIRKWEKLPDGDEEKKKKRETRHHWGMYLKLGQLNRFSMNDARAENGERKERMRICSHRIVGRHDSNDNTGEQQRSQKHFGDWMEKAFSTFL